MGAYASALIKKRHYWPCYIKGKEIHDHFKGLEVGETERLPGVINRPAYIRMLMSTYGSLLSNAYQPDSSRIVDGQTVKFKYNNVVGNHYKYWGAVYEHNSKRHDCGTNHGLSLE